MAKEGMIARSKKDYGAAIGYYKNFLKILAEVKNCDMSSLSPKSFNYKEDSAELLLISQVYWDLAKIYDRLENNTEFIHYLKQFTLFTIGYPYQAINAELLRVYIVKSQALHKSHFEEAYKKIFVTKKNCYIATHCFGEDHSIVNDLREFKKILLRRQLGENFVVLYYKISPTFVSFFENHKSYNFVFTELFAKPLLFIITNIIRPFIR